MTKVEMTYSDGTGDVRRFETDEEAIKFLRLCNVRYWAERREFDARDRVQLSTYQILP